MTAIEPDELEHRCNIDSLAELHEQRRLLYAPTSEGGKDYAYLRGMYGHNGRWEEQRKIALEALKLRALAPMAGDPAPPAKETDKLIDAWAHAHPEYVAMCQQARQETQRYLVLSVEDRILDDLIEDRKQRMFVYGGEIRMAA